MIVDVHGNSLPSMGFGHMYHELHHTKHDQRRKASTKNSPKQDPKPKGKAHAACGSSLPCSAISDSRPMVPSLQGTADRNFSHGTLQRAYKPGFVPGQNHSSSEARQRFHKSTVTHVTASLYSEPKAAQGAVSSHSPSSHPRNALPPPPVPIHSSG